MTVGDRRARAREALLKKTASSPPHPGLEGLADAAGTMEEIVSLFGCGSRVSMAVPFASTPNASRGHLFYFIRIVISRENIFTIGGIFISNFS